MIVRRAVAMLALAAAPLQAQPADPSALAAGWVRESWSITDGLPVNSINGLIQSRTGYVWAATFDGLVRFDGVRFTVYNSANSPGLPSDRIMSVLETRDSALWMNTEHVYLPVSEAGAQLTARELEVLRLMADGLGNKGIATALGISSHTAKYHVASVLVKLDAQSRTEAVTRGLREGLLPL